MSHSFKTILACVFLVSFLAIGFGAAPVQATTYLFTATSVYPLAASDFTLTYEDSGVDPRFSIGELGSFSGVVLWWNFVWTPCPTILAVPSYDAGISPFTDGEAGPTWTFARGVDGYPLNWLTNSWTYEQTEVVPLPPSVFLLGSGLLGLLGWRRFRKA
jgi:hypothetical protein